MRVVWLVIFGSLGTLARYSMEGAVQAVTGAAFPLGTMMVNLLGCFLLGVIGQYSIHHLVISPHLRSGITIGFFGAFTTFSTFSWESVHLLDEGDWVRAAVYIGLSLIGGLILLRMGMVLADRI